MPVRPPLHLSVSALLGAVLACLLLLTGCSSLEGTGDRGFVTGDGTVNVLEPGDRDEPVSLTGKALDGSALDVASFRGKPVVIVVWGSWCTPCRAEAPDVVAAAGDLEGAAQFLGIDIRDPSTEKAQAFERSFGVTYPSFHSPDGQALLAFPGALTPHTIPAFVVLDSEGRIAASIIGGLPSRRTLVDLVQQVADEATATGPSDG